MSLKIKTNHGNCIRSQPFELVELCIVYVVRLFQLPLLFFLFWFDDPLCQMQAMWNGFLVLFRSDIIRKGYRCSPPYNQSILQSIFDDHYKLRYTVEMSGCLYAFHHQKLFTCLLGTCGTLAYGFHYFNCILVWCSDVPK